MESSRRIRLRRCCTRSAWATGEKSLHVVGDLDVGFSDTEAGQSGGGDLRFHQYQLLPLRHRPTCEASATSVAPSRLILNDHAARYGVPAPVLTDGRFKIWVASFPTESPHTLNGIGWHRSPIQSYLRDSSLGVDVGRRPAWAEAEEKRGNMMGHIRVTVLFRSSELQLFFCQFRQRTSGCKSATPSIKREIVS